MDTIFDLYMSALAGLTAVVALLIFVTGLDDLFVDLVSAIGQAYRRLFIYSRFKRLGEDDLRAAPQKPVAIMVPAWREGEVIRRMLENTCRSFDYGDYRIFVGVYPNDAETLAEVKAAARQYPNITAVVGATPGPTNKADCLNTIYRAIRTHEAETGQRFGIFAMHDAEDVVHPLELRLLNYLIPRKDMVQLPVIALERRLMDFTGGHYMDEFAEFHAKDLVVREWLTGSVPCAGVGCGFSRRAMSRMADARGGAPFNPASLTEDYDFALTLNRLGLSQIFVRFSVLHWRHDLSDAASSRNKRRVRYLVATREFFPGDPGAAYRQKARWLLGIVFQNLRKGSWAGPWRLKYALFRDRKGVFTATLAILAYVVVLNYTVLLTIGWVKDGALTVPLLAAPGDWVWTLLMINGVLLLNRSLHRAWFTYQLYGPAQALMAIPRQIWGNAINFMAASRALRLFLEHKFRGKPLAWEKTTHAFPTSEDLRPFRQRLGQMLQEQGDLDEGALAIALSRHRRRGMSLGQALMAGGHVDERTLYETLARQAGVPFVSLRDVAGREGSRRALGLLPAAVRDTHRIVPFGEASDGAIRVASAAQPSDTVRSEIRSLTGRAVTWAMAAPSEIEAALKSPKEKSPVEEPAE